MNGQKLKQFAARIIAIGILFVLAINERRAFASEPIYQDEPESYWIDLLTNLDSAPFTTHWQTLGSNAIPVLIKALEKKDVPNASVIRTNAAFILSRSADSTTLVAIASVTFAYDFKVRPLLLPDIVKCLRDSDPEILCRTAKLLENYYPYPPENTDQVDVDELACAEIEKAVTNSDLHISQVATIAVRRGEQIELDKKKRHSVDLQGDKFERYIKAEKNHAILGAFARELAIYLAELHGNKWMATIHVVDEDGKPIPGAAVSVSYSVLPGLLGGRDDIKNIEGMTDSNGVFAATHVDSSFEIGVEVQKERFYRSRGLHELAFSGQFDSQKVALSRNPDVTIVLKKIIRQVPMFVNRVDLAHRKKPSMDKPIGFDFTIGDFVAPYGKGTNAQLFFTWHDDYEASEHSNYFGERTSRGYDGKMIISFPNPGDGIIEFDRPAIDRWSGFDVGSDLRSPQLAPLDGYQAQLIKTNRFNFGKLRNVNDYDHLHKNYLFRVNTALDEKGNIKGAQYGKIYGDFEEVITTYLNAEPNSRELEYDMQHNLGPGGKSGWFTY